MPALLQLLYYGNLKNASNQSQQVYASKMDSAKVQNTPPARLNGINISKCLTYHMQELDTAGLLGCPPETFGTHAGMSKRLT
jgi:hypothetical protein